MSHPDIKRPQLKCLVLLPQMSVIIILNDKYSFFRSLLTSSDCTGYIFNQHQTILVTTCHVVPCHVIYHLISARSLWSQNVITPMKQNARNINSKSYSKKTPAVQALISMQSASHATFMADTWQDQTDQCDLNTILGMCHLVSSVTQCLGKHHSA